MRTAILISSWCIANSINKNWITSDDTRTFLVCMFFIFICADIIELRLKDKNGTNKN